MYLYLGALYKCQNNLLCISWLSMRNPPINYALRNVIFFVLRTFLPPLILSNLAKCDLPARLYPNSFPSVLSCVNSSSFGNCICQKYHFMLLCNKWKQNTRHEECHKVVKLDISGVSILALSNKHKFHLPLTALLEYPLSSSSDRKELNIFLRLWNILMLPSKWIDLLKDL